MHYGLTFLRLMSGGGVAGEGEVGVREWAGVRLGGVAGFEVGGFWGFAFTSVF